MDPLFKVRECEQRGLIPKGIVKRMEKRMKYLEEGISRIGKASELKFPSYYIEPFLPLVISPVEIGKMGIIYARVIPFISDNAKLDLWVEISMPLILFGKKGTIHAVLAHEFSHYIFLLWKISKFEILSDLSSQTIFESIYADQEKLIKPEKIFKDKGLVRLVKNRFKNGLVDLELDEKTFKSWIKKNLPAQRLYPDMNVMRIPVSALLSYTVDSKLRAKIDEIFSFI